MDNLLDLIKKHWVEIGVIVIAFHTFLKALRDAIDKTPQTDDNWFEKLVTIMGKMVGYMFGKRPNA